MNDARKYSKIKVSLASPRAKGDAKVAENDAQR